MNLKQFFQKIEAIRINCFWLMLLADDNTFSGLQLNNNIY